MRGQSSESDSVSEKNVPCVVNDIAQPFMPHAVVCYLTKPNSNLINGCADMEYRFSPNELRIIGCLIEKELTTPDNYPLSLNALTNACNQKSNRDPLMDLSEILVRQTADNLVNRSILSNKSGGNSRVVKYSHRLRREDRLFDELAFDDDEVAVLAVLFLRGAQTLNEIKTRTSRLYPFENLEAVADTIAKLEAHKDGPFATMVGRASGQKEDRYDHLMSRDAVAPSVKAAQGADRMANESTTATDAPAEPAATSTAASQAGAADETRLQQLEDRIARLESKIEQLTSRLSAIDSQAN